MKALDNRHIIVMDYMVSKKQFEELTQMLEKSQEKHKEDESIDDALESLRT